MNNELIKLSPCNIHNNESNRLKKKKKLIQWETIINYKKYKF